MYRSLNHTNFNICNNMSMMTHKHMWRYMYIYIHIFDINTFKVFITHHECNINTNVSLSINKLQYTHRYNVAKSFMTNTFHYLWYNFSHILMYVFKIIYQRVCVDDALAWHDNYQFHRHQIRKLNVFSINMTE